MDWRTARIAIVCVASLASAAQVHAAKGDPVVKLIEPERGERRFVAPASILLEAQAQAAPKRSIVRVEFFSDETPIGETSVAPHAITWSDVPEGEYRLRVRATDNTGATDWSPFIRLRVRPNREPRVRLIEPVQDAQFNAPENIVLNAVARDRDHNLARVEFYADGTLIGTATTEPYSLSWAPVPTGDHVLLAKAIDAMGATDESRPIRIHVTGSPRVVKLYFIHVDHLNTPRLVADDQQRNVWRWDQQEAFGTNVSDEDPSGLGIFEFPVRFPGQYFDRETNLHYNYFRYYDPSMGRYGQSDPIGLQGGPNTYAYVSANPISLTDPFGLAYFAKRALRGIPWLGPASCNPIDDFFNTEISHEQLFFEDGGRPANIGYFSDGTLKEEPSPTDYQCRSGRYDDCIMRKAVASTPPPPNYCIIGGNCQTWAERVRKEYSRLVKDPQVQKECGVCK